MKFWSQGDVAERWKRQYFIKGTWASTQSGNSENVYNKIVGLTDPTEINEIIGNDTWTHFLCDNCRTYNEKGIIFEEADGEGNSVHICFKCVEEAHKLLC